jgi:8-amino-7-oxononanoate synthase
MFDTLRAALEIPLEDHESHPFARVETLVDFARERHLYPDYHRIDGGVNEPECTVDGRPYVSFCANNYLSLSEHPRVKRAAQEAIERYGLGPGGSRIISGNVDVIEMLERRIAQLTGMEDCLTFPTGYMANIAVFKALMEPFFGSLPYPRQASAIFVDEYDHGSIMDGCKLSSAKTVTFRHNDLQDLVDKLEQHATFTNRLIVTEGVFCLEGEIIDIPKYVEIARAHDAKLMVDDAHAIGVLGERGGGSPDLHGCAADIDILMGCMDKAMGGTGGYLCGRKGVVDYLRMAARSSVLSSALPCGMAAGILASIDLIEAGADLRESLATKARYLKRELRGLGFSVLGADDIPSVPLFVGSEGLGVAFSERLMQKGIFCPVVRWPAVPPKRARFRISLMARHEQRHLDHLLEACAGIGRELGMIH